MERARLVAILMVVDVALKAVFGKGVALSSQMMRGALQIAQRVAKKAVEGRTSNSGRRRKMGRCSALSESRQGTGEEERKGGGMASAKGLWAKGPKTCVVGGPGVLFSPV